MAKKKKNRNPYRATSNYKQIVYPESAPPNWIQLIIAEIERGYIRYAIISPLHDMDRYSKADETEATRLLARIPATTDAISVDTARILQELGCGASIRAGELKKPHFHVEFALKHPRRNHEASAYFKKLTNGTNVIARDDLRGSVRYLAHLDEDPNKKVWYDPEKIIVLGDIKIDKYLLDEDKSLGTLTAWNELRDLIDENNVRDMYDFEQMMKSKNIDIDLKNQVMKNINLRTRARDYVHARTKRVDEDNIQESILRMQDIREIKLKEKEKELDEREKRIEQMEASPFLGAYKG